MINQTLNDVKSKINASKCIHKKSVKTIIIILSLNIPGKLKENHLIQFLTKKKHIETVNKLALKSDRTLSLTKRQFVVDLYLTSFREIFHNLYLKKHSY